MPRQRVLSSARDLSPGLAVVTKVDAQSRIRLPTPIGLIVPWLTHGSGGLIECRLTVGAAGGAQVATAEFWNRRFRAVSTRAKSRKAGALDGGAVWVRYSRFLASSWPLTIRAEKSRFSFTLPEDPRKLGLVPEANERAVVFGLGGLLEIWKADEWLKHVRSVAPEIEALHHRALEELAERAEAP